jgi:hypothetical protein
VVNEIVTYDELDRSAPQLVTVSATQQELSSSRLGKTRRTSFYLYPITAGLTVTLTKGDAAAVANTGYVLTTGVPFVETDSENFKSYQGAYHIVGSGAGQVALVEVFD